MTAIKIVKVLVATTAALTIETTRTRKATKAMAYLVHYWLLGTQAYRIQTATM
jgi:hypothetical protein